jgi:uncharacterized protein
VSSTSRIAIDTNVNNLISRDLPWRQRELEYQAAFPQGTKLILVVVEGPTPEQTGAATRALSQGLSNEPALFRSVEEEGGGAFFQHKAESTFGLHVGLFEHSNTV